MRQRRKAPSFSRYRRRLALAASALTLVSIVGAVTPASSAAARPATTHVAPAAVQSALSSTPVSTGDMTSDVIYQLITDRFYDGNTSNDNPSSSPNLNSSDHSNWQL